METNNPIIEVEVVDPELSVQEVVEDVKESVKLFCGCDVDVFDENVTGKRFKLRFPEFVTYQIEMIINDLNEMIMGISAVIVDPFNGLVVPVGVEEDEPTVVDTGGDTERIEKMLERGVVVDGMYLEPDGED